MSNITITRALVELKTLDSRIEKAKRDAIFISYKCNSEENTKDKITPNKLQQINDLIAYRNRVKAAIIHSNATTTVVISKKEYTVAEAIERKSSISYERELLATLKTQLGQVTRQIENHNADLRKKADSMIEKSLGSNQKTNTDELKSFTESYISANRAEIVDPLGIAKRIEDLEEHIVNFDSEVDLVLSESNATTKITV